MLGSALVARSRSPQTCVDSVQVLSTNTFPVCCQTADLDLLLWEAEVKVQRTIITVSKTGILVLASGPLGSWLVSGPDRRDLYSKVNRFPSMEERVP